MMVSTTLSLSFLEVNNSNKNNENPEITKVGIRSIPEICASIDSFDSIDLLLLTNYVALARLPV
jgi:hypothetical protein